MASEVANSSSESLYSCRKRQMAQRYLAGVARAPHRLAPVLQSSMSSPDTSLTTPEDDKDSVIEAVATKRAKRE